MRRVLLVVAGAAALAVAVASSGSAQSSGGPRTIHFVSTTVKGGFAPKGRPRPGSTLGFTDTLKGDDGSTGHDVGICTIVTRSEAFCNVQFILDKGQLSFQGTFPVRSNNSPGSVIGGVGAYEGARGSISVTDVNSKTANITVSLL
jgi:hypothetical protein